MTAETNDCTTQNGSIDRLALHYPSPLNKIVLNFAFGIFNFVHFYRKTRQKWEYWERFCLYYMLKINHGSKRVKFRSKLRYSLSEMIFQWKKNFEKNWPFCVFNSIPLRRPRVNSIFKPISYLKLSFCIKKLHFLLQNFRSTLVLAPRFWGTVCMEHEKNWKISLNFVDFWFKFDMSMINERILTIFN